MHILLYLGSTVPSCCASTWPLAAVALGDGDLLGGPDPRLPGLPPGKGPREQLGAPGAHAAGSGGAGRCSGRRFSIWGKTGASPHGLVSSARCPCPVPALLSLQERRFFWGHPVPRWGRCLAARGQGPAAPGPLLGPAGPPAGPTPGASCWWCPPLARLGPDLLAAQQGAGSRLPHPMTKPSQLTPAWARGAQAGTGPWLGRKFPCGL